MLKKRYLKNLVSVGKVIVKRMIHKQYYWLKILLFFMATQLNNVTAALHYGVIHSSYGFCPTCFILNHNMACLPLKLLCRDYKKIRVRNKNNIFSCFYAFNHEFRAGGHSQNAVCALFHQRPLRLRVELSDGLWGSMRKPSTAPGRTRLVLLLTQISVVLSLSTCNFLVYYFLSTIYHISDFFGQTD